MPAHHVTVEALVESSDRSDTVDPLQADFVEALVSCHRASPDLFRSCVEELRVTDGQWADRLAGLLDDVNLPAITTQAEQIGQQLFRVAASGAAR